MSPAPRKATRGYAQVPNSIVENQAVLTRAELALMLILMRRNANREPTTVSDQHWQNWTGLSPRAKEYAIAGLKQKGLDVDGRGDQMLMRFERSEWERYVLDKTHDCRPRTLGRVERPKAKPAIHPECVTRGCALAHSCEERERNAQPVAQDSSAAAALEAPKASPPKNGSSPIVSIQVAQPVAQLWAATLAELKSWYPLAGLAFLARLLAIVTAMFTNLTDRELAAAVKYAGNLKKGSQKSEGLFLTTVPAALDYLRSKPPTEPDALPAASKPVTVMGLAAAAEWAIAEKASPKLAPLAAIAAGLADQVRRGVVPDAAYEDKALAACWQAREMLADRGRLLLDADQSEALKVSLKAHVDDLRAEKRVVRYTGEVERVSCSLTAAQIANRVRQFEIHEVFRILGLPWWLFYQVNG